MFDKEKLETYFNSPDATTKSSTKVARHSSLVRQIKLIFPAIAAMLIGLLVIFPTIHNDEREFSLDITRPRTGELEKLHIENTLFYITDKDNRVNNFTASNIDETSPSSKIIKLTSPEGTIPGNNNTWVNIKAIDGTFNQNTNILQLTNNVVAFYSDGMEALSDEMFFDFNTSQGYGNAPLTADGIFGSLSTQGFEYYNKKNLLIFKGKTYIKISKNSFKDK